MLRSIALTGPLGLLLAMAALLPAAESATAPPLSAEGPVVARAPELFGTALRVNGDAITSAQVIAPIQDQLAALAEANEPEAFAGKAGPLVLRSTMNRIYQLLLYQHALKQMEDFDSLDDVLDKAVQDRRRQVIVRLGGSEAQAEATLAEQGRTLDEELADVRRDLVINSFREMHFTPNLEITRAQMIQYYRQHADEFTKTAELAFRLVDVQVGDGSRSEARARAETARAELQAGRPFDEVAREYSDGYRAKYGGLWESRDPASLREVYQPLVAALQELDPNDLTDIVESDNRFFVAQLIEYVPARTIVFSDAQDDIREKLRQQRWRKYTDDLSQSLMKQAVMGDVEEFVRVTTFAVYQQHRGL